VSQLVEQQGGQMSGIDVPALLHMYKARLAIACCNHRAAKKEVRRHTQELATSCTPYKLQDVSSLRICCGVLYVGTCLMMHSVHHANA
jgi:hypothetical protein